MKLSKITALCGIAACACVLLTVDGAAQGRGGARSGAPGGQGGRAGAQAPVPAPTPRQPVADDPFSGPVVTNAPFSADGVTTVTQVLGDGTRIEQNTTARFYRDSSGRVRREQTILGLAGLNPTTEARTAITIVPNATDGVAYTLDPSNRTARQTARTGTVALRTTAGELFVQADNLVISSGDLTGRRVTRVEADAAGRGSAQAEESLGTRQIEGVTATGRRTKTVIPTGQIGNDRPIEITDERWESADLRLLIRSHHHDPRTGDVEYRLTNIQRSEQPADLFAVPSDYQILGGRGGGGGGRGGLGTGGARSGGGQ